MRKNVGPGGTHEALVHFESESAAKTALLLTNALIVDRPISVVAYVAPAGEVGNAGRPEDVVRQGDEIANKDFSVPDEQRSKTSVVASMLAAGYSVGADTLAKAKEYDEQYSISQQLKIGAEELKKKVLEVDDKLGVSATTVALANATQQKVKEIDEQYKISQTATDTVKSIDQRWGISAGAASVGAFMRQASIDLWNKPFVQSAAQAVQSVTEPVGKTFEEIEQETQRQIEEKRKSRGDIPAGGVPPVASPAPAGAADTPQPAAVAAGAVPAVASPPSPTPAAPVSVAAPSPVPPTTAEKRV
jgi:hypothetical protein